VSAKKYESLLFLMEHRILTKLAKIIIHSFIMLNFIAISWQKFDAAFS